MIPPARTRPLGLQPSIFNREQIRKNPLLIHRQPKQLPSITGTSPQFLTRRIHRLPLTLQIEVLRSASLGLVQVPGSVDRPVSEVPCSRESEWAGCFWVVEEVAD